MTDKIYTKHDLTKEIVENLWIEKNMAFDDVDSHIRDIMWHKITILFNKVTTNPQETRLGRFSFIENKTSHDDDDMVTNVRKK